jgi:Transcription factor regulating root and shoot growth via Pin3
MSLIIVFSFVQRESFYSRVGSTRESPAVTPPLGKELGSRAGSTYRPSSTASCSGKGMYYAPSGSVPDPTDHIFGHHFNLNSASTTGALAMDAASRATTSSRDEASVSVSNVSDLDATEWIEEDQPGVYVTIRELGDGTRELRRIRFRRVNIYLLCTFKCELNHSLLLNFNKINLLSSSSINTTVTPEFAPFSCRIESIA